MKQLSQADLMKSPGAILAKALGLIVLGVALAAAGIYVGDTDDAPGAALLGIVLMIVAVALGVRLARRQPSP
jgi:cobalamin biosynthesis protein CobD/CbiB